MDEAFALESILRDELEDNGEEDLMKWATFDNAVNDALYAAYRRSHVNLLRIRREKPKFIEQLVDIENNLYVMTCCTSVLPKIISGSLNSISTGSCIRLCHPSSTYRNSTGASK